MFERRLGRKPVPLILNGGSWIAKPSLPLTRASLPTGREEKALRLAVSLRLAASSFPSPLEEKVRMRASPAPRILFPF